MNRARLVPCPSCARHVRVGEMACPFCAAALSSARARALAPVPRSPITRLGRAALFALGTTAAANLGACGGDDDAVNPVDSGTDTLLGTDGPTPTPAYGAPSFDAAPNPDAADASSDDAANSADALHETGASPLYGAAPNPPKR